MVLFKFNPLLIHLVILCWSFMSIFSYKSIKSCRLIQFDSGEKQYGSQYSALNYIASYYKGDNLRKIALVPLSIIKSLSEIEAVIKSSANSILFILPHEPYTKQFDALIDQIQIFLSEQTLFIPVFFTYETEELNGIVEELKREYEQSTGEKKKNIFDYLGLRQNYLHFSLNSAEPKKKPSLQLENFYGFLEVPSQSASPNPIIAIVSHYDSFGVVSELPSGVNSNGSGVIAMMELIRILSKFYENYENVIKYDILFVLTSAGNLNFEGTQQFINSLEPSISENLQYVLCLDSIGANNEDLHLHFSRFPKDHEDTPNKLYQIFNTTAKNMNMTLNYNKKKVFLTNPVVPWEHEQFSKKKIIASTLSSRAKQFEHNFNRTLLTDTSLNKTILKKNIKFLAESILAFLFDYNMNKFAIFKEEENLIDSLNVDRSLAYLKRISRFPLSIEKGSPVNNDLYSFFATYLQKAKRQSFEYSAFSFYDTNSGDVKIYSVKSKMIDLYLLIVIFLYLLVLYVYTKGVGNFIAGLRGAFNSEDN